MLTLYLIRHGKTAGNQQRRYIGRTDEPLCEEGKQGLAELTQVLPALTDVWGSPMLRCIETAELLFPQAEYHHAPLLRECDFGRFENHTYEELAGDSAYQAWLASMGTLPFPEGEAHEDFIRRCGEGFCLCIEEMLERGLEQSALVLHGGSIMAVLSLYSGLDREFYHWQVSNGDGFLVELNPEQWVKSHRLASVRPLSEGCEEK